MRLAAQWRLPLVFTNHTRYHLYSHYLGFQSGCVQRLVRGIAVGYVNGCAAVVAPSESIAAELRANGVTTHLEVIPTGVDLARFQGGNREVFRRRHGIADEAVLIGHIGRLAPEKNLRFLLDALLQFLAKRSDSRAVIAGEGAYKTELERQISASAMRDRIVLLGNLSAAELKNAYAAYDVFVFASQSETQGMVVTEAMAAGVPVIALDTPGVREVVRNDVNGYLLPDADEGAFATAVNDFAELPMIRKKAFKRAATATAEAMSMAHCIDRLIMLYESLLSQRPWRTPSLARGLRGEFRIWNSMACAFGSAFWPSVPL
jgi:1,2-diacylglycerol 3-alpha-glucosyltransferase